MSAWAIIFIAEAAPAGNEFPWGTFWTAAAAAIAFVALGYQAGWLPPKYRMADADPLNDRLTLKIFGPPEIAARSPRQARVVPRHEWPKYRNDGFKIVRVAFDQEFIVGRQCVYVAERKDGTLEERLLVARADGPPIPLSFHEQLDELGSNLSELTRAFNTNLGEIKASPGHYREKLRASKQQYDLLYVEYRQRRAAGEGFHTMITQLTNFAAKIEELNARLDGLS